MDQDNRPTPGAPSDDTTSALFVSARKKQLEQQELERRAKEKEEQRLAAEAEVQRLEREVEERRRRAEWEAQNADQEARARQAQTQTYGYQNQPYAQQPYAQQPYAPQPAAPQPAAKQSLFQNKKMLAIIGGGAAAVIILVVVLIIVFSGGGGAVKVDPYTQLDALYEKNGLSFSYPSVWTLGREVDYPVDVAVDSGGTLHKDVKASVRFVEVTEEYLELYYDNDYDYIFAGAKLLDRYVMKTAGGGTYGEYPLEMDTDGGYLISGGTTLTYKTSSGGGEVDIRLGFVPFANRLLLYIIEMPRLKGSEDALTLCDRIAKTGALEPYEEYYNEDGEEMFYDINSSIYFWYPSSWIAVQTAGSSTVYAPITVRQSDDDMANRMLIYNYTPEANEFLAEGGSGLDNLVSEFGSRFLEDAGYYDDDLYNIFYGDVFYNEYGNEVIALYAENDYAYFCFILVKKSADPLIVAAVAIETSDTIVRDAFFDVMDTLDLQ